MTMTSRETIFFNVIIKYLNLKINNFFSNGVILFLLLYVGSCIQSVAVKYIEMIIWASGLSHGKLVFIEAHVSRKSRAN